MRRLLFYVFFALIASSICARAADSMNAAAERYAYLVLALGQHDPDYVDAFYGPAEWKTQAEKEKKSLDAIGAEAAELIAILAKTSNAAKSTDEMRGWIESFRILLILSNGTNTDSRKADVQ